MEDSNMHPDGTSNAMQWPWALNPKPYLLDTTPNSIFCTHLIRSSPCTVVKWEHQGLIRWKFWLLAVKGIHSQEQAYITFKELASSDNAIVTASTHIPSSMAVDADYFIGCNINYQGQDPTMRNWNDIIWWSIILLSSRMVLNTKD